MSLTIGGDKDFPKLRQFLTKAQKNTIRDSLLRTYGLRGVAALSAATPVDTGTTASSWSYRITRSKSRVSISFHNSNVNNGVPIAIILQYGHATRGGGYVQGRDYINPAVQPIFDALADEAHKEVSRL